MRFRFVPGPASSVLLLLALAAACDATGQPTGGSGGSGGGSAGSGGDTTGGTGGLGGAGGATGGAGGGGLFTGGTGGTCTTLDCKQVDCGGGSTTALTGTIFDPSGTLPLYNVAVYVPNAPLDPIEDTLTCDACVYSGQPLVSAITDTQGKFTLTNVPVGDDIPLVIQVGKWRRQITIPKVEACVENKLDDPQVARLPKSMQEGNIPRIALSTGGSDPLFCLLRRLGLDDAEYGVAGSAARVHFFQGVTGATGYDAGFGSSPGATFPLAEDTLWATDWSNYDVVLLSCEGDEYPANKDGHRPALVDYINTGGRVFTTHYHYNWFQGDAPAELQSVAQFTSVLTSFDDQVDINQTFPKGLALAKWMDFVDGASPIGHFFVTEGREHTLNVNGNVATTWVRHTPVPVYFSFNAPIGAPEDQQCGRMVHSDIHVSSGAGDAYGDFPSACYDNPLTEQEKALLFMLFDLSGCIIPDNQTPCPPGQDHCGGPNDPACNGSCMAGCCVPPPS